MILHRGSELRFDGLGNAGLGNAGAKSQNWGMDAGEGPSLDLDAVTAAHIRKVLGQTGGKIHGPGGAGELLGVNPNTLRYKMKKLGIPFRKEREST